MDYLEKIRDEFGYEPDTLFRVEGNRVAAFCRRSESDNSRQKSDSPDSQNKVIKNWAREEKLVVARSFMFNGYTSKAGSARPDIDELLEYVLDKKNKISNVVVVHSERLTRDGIFGAQFLMTLRENGIGFIDIDDPQDIFTNKGFANQAIKFWMAQLDNEKRKVYIDMNIRNYLAKGMVMTSVPCGYDQGWVDDVQGGEQLITINDEGVLLKRAFEMKLNEGLSNTEIAKRMKELGFDKDPARYGVWFKNPFYCGLVKDQRSPFPRGIGLGNHQGIITMEEFCRINGLANLNRRKIKITDRKELPLRRHLKCAGCGYSITGEYKKKKKLGYYRCNKGCKWNMNSNQMHDLYINLLGHYHLNEELTPLYKEKLFTFFEQLNEEQAMRRGQLVRRLAEVRNSKDITVDKLLDETDAEIADEFKNRIKGFNKTIDDLELRISEYEDEFIDIESLVDSALEFTSSFVQLWREGELETRLDIQNLAFPDGVIYDNKSNSLTPLEVNPILDIIGRLGNDNDVNGQNDLPEGGLTLNSENRTSDEVNVCSETSDITELSESDVSNIIDSESNEISKEASPYIRSNYIDREFISISRINNSLREIRYFMKQVSK